MSFDMMPAMRSVTRLNASDQIVQAAGRCNREAIPRLKSLRP
jgi:CRISPR/Cas system-associated endonuclease/helicase Cas3